MKTPILVLIFNRPEKAKGLYEIICRQKPAKLYIAADGPRQDRSNEPELCRQTRSIFDNIDWPCEKKTFYREQNAGCGVAVNEAITWFFKQEENGIILEDDCHPNNDFFTFCEEMLHRYKDHSEIKLISGSNYQDGRQWGKNSYYFSKMCHIWGWASWRRAWDEYEFSLAEYDDKSFKEQLRAQFPNKRFYRFWEHIYRMMKEKPIDTWDYQFCFSIWKNNGLSIIPNKNLVSNIGFGKDATHTHDENGSGANQPTMPMGSIKHPNKVRCNNLADIYYFYNKELKRPPRLLHKIKRILNWY
ncbi:MAG: hypothetical protein ACWA6U_08665 [Breznakibacter sp.]